MSKAPAVDSKVWFNSKPLSLKELEGKIVLYDFWTYSCVNCRRTIPYLKQWWKKYKDKGFLIIGIHTPEFDFERDPGNVQCAIRELGVEWPVVLDEYYENWENFNNHSWPAKYLADKNGAIVYAHFGEGKYTETEKAIQMMLKEKDRKLRLPELGIQKKYIGMCFPFTPEIYCGYQRGFLSNKGGFLYNKVKNYTPPKQIPQDSLALKGTFLAMRDYVQTDKTGAELMLRFRATEVNVVLNPLVGNTVVDVLHSGKFLKELSVEKGTMYNLIKSNKAEDGIISIRLKTGAIRAYAFTFSGRTEYIK
ncbi:MAG: redoxin domain-containing protein [Candidatus Margulisiibacteriota bacterium]|nr:redoxin domain-containing protein [Candidatus Margulisiibacteriota bacterium]